jgi:uncharacterized protein Yka (UPF0111/DUF47 family)
MKQNDEFMNLIKRIMQTAEYAKSSSSNDIVEMTTIIDKQIEGNDEEKKKKLIWIAGWSFASIKSALRSITSIHKLAEELLDMSSKVNINEHDIDFSASKYNASIADAITSTCESYRAHEEYSLNDDAEKLYECIEHSRDAIKSLADALELLGCKREAHNVRCSLEQGVKP